MKDTMIFLGILALFAIAATALVLTGAPDATTPATAGHLNPLLASLLAA